MQGRSRLGAPDADASRGVALSDRDAVAWLADRGWSVASDERPLRLYADEVRVRGFRMARVWHTPARLSSHPTRAPDGQRGRIELVTVVDGALSMRWGEGRSTVSKGDSILLPLDDAFEIETSVPTGRVEFSLPLRDPLARLSAATVLDSSEFSRILVALASSILASPLTPAESGYPQLTTAVEHAALAFLRSSAAGDRPGGVSSAEAALFALAIDVIDEEASDPSFSVAVLARRLRVSARRVGQVFAAYDSTAQAHIRSARIGVATRLLEQHRATSAEERERIAHAAGFRTARTMAARLREWDGRPAASPGQRSEDRGRP
ncbi:AraC-type DNA-binding protein [Rathayibacter oskolensis]|uniref:AraC-type DNA-binding protein n=1 Tax=Rathayibacter oskolensis TaxID=1891671 RepID=A0A1X7MZY0_9MICO|nr:AraC family transcriptional regulator [Rathayibacter oskolensis]SMH29898.1 AraC-type DNA-binding protein [Rathayibacter oskolensis]